MRTRATTLFLACALFVSVVAVAPAQAACRPTTLADLFPHVPETTAPPVPTPAAPLVDLETTTTTVTVPTTVTTSTTMATTTTAAAVTTTTVDPNSIPDPTASTTTTIAGTTTTVDPNSVRRRPRHPFRPRYRWPDARMCTECNGPCWEAARSYRLLAPIGTAATDIMPGSTSPLRR